MVKTLLFISDNAKLDSIKNTLQPNLKLRINIERDFDCGLNDVFRKHPALVFIQEQIDSVTGESVARHIQLLLGSGAPSFILMHDGNSGAKPIKGLYEHLIDLSQPEAKLQTEIQETVKLLLGPQWQKIYIPPKMVICSCPDDFLSDVFPRSFAETTTTDPIDALGVQYISPDEPFEIISSIEDQLVEILSEEAREEEEKEASPAIECDGMAGKSFSETLAPSVPDEPPLMLSDSLHPEVQVAVASEDHLVFSDYYAPVGQDSSTVIEPAVPVPAISVVSEQMQSSPISPADFRDESEKISVAETTVDNQWVFEGEQSLKTSNWKWYRTFELLFVLCLLLGGWYLIKQKPQPSQSGAKESIATKQPDPAVQQPKPTKLPTFIPLEGHDPSFTASNPGWERYAGAEVEFRTFRSDRKLKAVQLLAAKGHNISASMLKTVLIDLTGDGEYRVTSRERKLGFEVQHAEVNGKAELLIYRKKDSIHAVVVSIN
jgi:hypothetical protein